MELLLPDRFGDARTGYGYLAVFSRLGVTAEVGEVRDEFCPGDHSMRVGDNENGMKVVGIAQRISRRATSVGSLRRAGYEAGTQHAIEAFAAAAEHIYGAVRTPVDENTLELSSNEGAQYLVA